MFNDVDCVSLQEVSSSFKSNSFAKSNARDRKVCNIIINNAVNTQIRLYAKLKKGKTNVSSKLKKLKSRIQKETRTSYWNYLNNIICDPTEHKYGTTKRFWGFIKSLKQDSCGVAPLRENGILKSSPVDKANILNRQFSSVFTRPDTSSLPNLGVSPFPTMETDYGNSHSD